MKSYRLYFSSIFFTVVFLVSPAWAFLVDFDNPVLIRPSGTGQPAAPKTLAEKYYLKGIDSLAKGELSLAKEAFQKSFKEDPKMIKSLLGLAEILFKEKQVAEAGQVLKEALSLAPDHAAVHNAWGRYLYLEKRFVEAEDALRKAILLDPQDAAPHIDLGDLYMNAFHNMPEAEKAYRQALTIDPKHAGARYALGMALLGSGNPKQAKTELEEAGWMAPDNPLPFYALARIYREENNSAKALHFLENVLKIQPNFMSAYIERGDIYLAGGEYEQALKEYQRILQLDRGFVAAHVKIGMVRQIRQQWNEAQEAYQTALAIDPNQAFACNNLAWLNIERQGGDLVEALRWAEKAVELAPGAAQFWDTLGWVHRARGEKDSAVAALKKAVALPHPSAENFYHLGVVYMEAGNKADAADALKKALALEQNFAGAEDAKQRLTQLGP
jgi:Tfp pilus assembly protein PilF